MSFRRPGSAAFPRASENRFAHRIRLPLQRIVRGAENMGS
ncbi:hypothetical protein BURPS305_6179 [Burkholderia pseudomallei 305]|nr:hypothetical protein BURPS305_6179 [Burkholderia pseudomallei 305]EEC34286.1 hypothetical protein BUC_6911 [Burkholderia pseudomallei 576]EEP84503.1 hypothetical protein BMAGB8_A0167 [Burkholderia mallei GB8 horse 4]